MKSLIVRPHAKINLGLRILGVRSDGYHEIRTRFQTVDLRDEMEISLSPREIELRVEGARLAGDRSNLVVRAAEALREAGRGLPGARIRLVKAIPLAAGLGGGSSDAAAALLALERLWGLELDPGELRRIATRLGADVPFFLQGGTAVGNGRGDEIRPLPDLPPYGICLILAPFESSTAEVYRRWDLLPPVSRSRVPARDPDLQDLSGAESRETVHNDLQDVVFAAHPELRHFRELLYDAGAVAASVSGSGPSLFGLFPSPEAARAFGDSRDWEPYRVLECARVGRAEYLERVGLAPGRELGTS